MLFFIIIFLVGLFLTFFMLYKNRTVQNIFHFLFVLVFLSTQDCTLYRECIGGFQLLFAPQQYSPTPPFCGGIRLSKTRPQLQSQYKALQHAIARLKKNVSPVLLLCNESAVGRFYCSGLNRTLIKRWENWITLPRMSQWTHSWQPAYVIAVR